MREMEHVTVKNRLPFFLVGAGVLMMVLGVFVFGWVWLALLGFLLTIAAAFSIKLSFFGNWIPALYDEKEQDSLPPPPTMNGR
jgi:glucan phosphoethanolaminetransferase (alkaline phosphatase superfamily)